MNQSFYTGALGARNQQTKLNVVSNNIANVNTVGFKPEYSVFSDLVYSQIQNSLEASNIKTGSGSKVDEVKTNMAAMPYQSTGLEHDYAVQGDGFFYAEGSGFRRHYIYQRRTVSAGKDNRQILSCECRRQASSQYGSGRNFL